MPVSVVGSVVGFIVALLIGGLAIYVSARIVVDVNDYGHAIVTALIGAIAWALTSWVPIIGSLLALVVWVAVIKWRYPGGWLSALLMGGAAWLAALAILIVLRFVSPIQLGAVGVPGV